MGNLNGAALQLTHSLSLWLASLLLIASCLPTLAQNITATPASGRSDQERFSMIVVFREFRTLLMLKTMCIRNALAYRLAAGRLGLRGECQMPNICRRVYSNTVFGFAGEFTEAELQQVQRCLPQAIFYRELDGVVHKAEDSSFWHPDQAATQGSLASQGKRRRLTDVQVIDIPRVEAFEEVNMTRGTEGTPVDFSSLAIGSSLGATGDKTQQLQTELWNLDRIHQRDLPLDSKFVYGSNTTSGTGKGVTIYVVDSGIMPSHQEFQSADGSGSRASFGYDFVEDDEDSTDCDGHGTHVASTAVGLQVGVAKQTKVVSVRILDCDGSGTISDTVAGLDWVAANAQKPAVVVLSLGIQVGSWSRVLEAAVRSLITKYGISVVVASGNSGVDSCFVAPANVPETITVAATDLPTKYNTTQAGDLETMYRWSNTGSCVDLFAPGVDVYAACGSETRCEVVDDTAYTFASGTSMAVPMVAGVAALYLEDHPDAQPREVLDALTRGATQGAIEASGFKAGTANRMLYSRLGETAEVMASNGP